MKIITMPRVAMLAAVTASLGLAACGGSNKQAEAVASSSDAAADAMDDQAAQMTGVAADKMNDAADATRADGNTKADAIEDATDKAN